MPDRPLIRPLLTVLTAAVAALCAASPASAADGTYTHMLCANPDTGVAAVGRDSQFPAGVTMAHGHVAMATLEGAQRCGGPAHGASGAIIKTNGSYALAQGVGTSLTFTLPADLQFRGATIYARTNTTGGLMAGVSRSSSTALYAQPLYFICQETADGRCSGTGSYDPFSAANRIDIGTAHDRLENGFQWFLKCAWFGCTTNDNDIFALYGGKVSVGDVNAPTGALGVGDLAADDVLRGTEEATFSAGDSGGGVYRSRVIVDDTPQPWSVVDAANADCRDANPANADAYEFNARRPCPASASGTASLDTTQLAEGEHRLRLVVEDAGGKAVTLMDRRVVVDNVSAPVAGAAGRIAGAARRGSSLVVLPGAWSNGGAAGEPVLTYAWERCSRDGSSCVAIPGATDIVHVVGDADLGSRLRVAETATNGEGSTVSRTAMTEVVTAEDGSLPPAVDGRDNDCDGAVDETGEGATCPGGGPQNPGDNPSGAGATPIPGSNGRDGVNGQNGGTGAVGAAGSASAVNGENASPGARLTVSFTRGGPKGSVAYGKTAAVRGRLVDPSGRPIRNAIVDVSETPALRGARAAAGRPAVTDGDGAFTYQATGKAGTRSLMFVYRYLRQGPAVAQASLALTVKARVKLSVSLRGSIASYRGTVLAGAIPKGGKLVIVQGRSPGASWQTFATRRAGKGGAFKGRYRLKVRRPGRRLQFRVRVLAESGWNFSGVTSKAVTRRVR